MNKPTDESLKIKTKHSKECLGVLYGLKEKIMEKLINYLKENNIKFEQDTLGLGVITIRKQRRSIRIRKDYKITGSCKYEYMFNYSFPRSYHSNFEHLTNTVIRIFLEDKPTDE